MFLIPTSDILILEVWSGAQQSTPGDSSEVGGSLWEVLTWGPTRPFILCIYYTTLTSSSVTQLVKMNGVRMPKKLNMISHFLKEIMMDSRYMDKLLMENW